MRVYLEIEGVEKKLNYKKVILVIAIIIAIVACVYIGIILPKIVAKQNEINDGIKLAEKNESRENIDLDLVGISQEIIPSREEDTYPVITPEGFEKIKNIYESNYKRVYLTFDDGPSQTVTTQILKILDDYNVKATFFVLGSRVELYPELVKETYEKGHYIANHGYSHKYSYIYDSIQNIIDEYKTTENLIRNALGKDDYYSNVFRFPGGSPGGKYAKIKADSIPVLESNNIAYLDWNCLNRDSEGNFTKEELIQFTKDTSFEKASVVVLMHDAGTKVTTYEALPEIIEYFRDNGYVFETLYDILDGQ